MRQGVAWTDIECAHLPKLWSNPTQDPVFRIEQTSACFWDKLYQLLSLLCTEDALENQYESRNMKAARFNFEAISTDVSKSLNALRSVTMFQPRGTLEEQNFSMAIALHLTTRTVVSFDEKHYSHNQWIKKYCVSHN